MKCKKCNSEDFMLRKISPHKALFCRECNEFMKLATKKEIRTYSDVSLSKINSEQNALRMATKRFIELNNRVIENGDCNIAEKFIYLENVLSDILQEFLPDESILD